MKIKEIILILSILVVSMLNTSSDFEEYKNLKNYNVAIIKKEDLPEEFCDESYNIIVDFIEKTKNLNYEWVLYFDYYTGEILKCKKGKSNKVTVNFDEKEFTNNNVASIHNHPSNLLSSPSSKNFGILKRKFEDYELISGVEYFWILKAQGLHENLIKEMNNVSDIAFRLSLLHCTSRYRDELVFNKMQDLRYGNELLNYINNKNINDIQLTKLEYVKMNNEKTAVYQCRERITNPEVLKFARDFENCPYTPSAKDMMYAFYQSIGVDIEYDEIFADK